MKVFPEVLTSAVSGGDGISYGWSPVFDISRHAKNGFFNLEWDIATSGTTVRFAWSGSSSVAGTQTTGSPLIKSGASSGSGPNQTGRDFSGFDPEAFPFIRIGAAAEGTTATISTSLIVD